MIESIQKSLDYIEEHLLENITIEEIAARANISASHFQRIFLILTDISVGEYIRRRRLTLSAQELVKTNCKIIDIASKYGYDTPESFSKAFRKQHALTPSDARKGAGPLQAYNRLMITVKLKGVEPMKYQIIERNAFQVIGVKRELPCGTGVSGVPGIPEFWKESHANGTVESLAKLIDGEIKGLLGITDNYNEEKNTIDYWIAAEHNGDVPDGYSSMQIPAAKWVIFEVVGPMPDAMIESWQKIYSEWFPSNGYRPAEIAPFEIYLDQNLYHPNSKNEIRVAIK